MEQVKKFIREHPHMWWGLYLPVYLTMFFIIEHLITDNYWATQTAIDDYIPFCEWFVFPYDSWSFLLVAIGIYLIVKDAEGFRRYMWTIMITFTTATVFCALVPNGQDLRPAVMEHQNIAAWLLQNTYNLDTNTNVLPSVHVLGGRCGGSRRVAHAGPAEVGLAGRVHGPGRGHHRLYPACQAARLHRHGGGSAGGGHRLCHRIRSGPADHPYDFSEGRVLGLIANADVPKSTARARAILDTWKRRRVR